MAVAHVAHVAIAVIEKNQQILIAKRPAHVHLGGLWEFPGGKVEPGENVIQALKREIQEELGINVTESQPLIKIPYNYPDKNVLLDVYRISEFNGEAHGKEQQEIRWVGKNELALYNFPAANLPIIHAVNLPKHYMITPEPSLAKLDQFLKQLELALQNNIKLIQLRAKNLPIDDLATVYQQVLPITERHHATLFVNGDQQTALRLKLQHLHLNSRALMNTKTAFTDLDVSASCHNAAEIEHAVNIGAKFIVVSCVKSTFSHPDVNILGWKNFQALCLSSKLPVYALGGLGKNDMSSAIIHGAQGIAGISAFWGGEHGNNTS